MVLCTAKYELHHRKKYVQSVVITGETLAPLHYFRTQSLIHWNTFDFIEMFYFQVPYLHEMYTMKRNKHVR